MAALSNQSKQGIILFYAVFRVRNDV